MAAAASVSTLLILSITDSRLFWPCRRSASACVRAQRRVCGRARRASHRPADPPRGCSTGAPLSR
jgi:hypothetical protein